ncbi:hypothetical protein Caci_5364 [Catenulispora acidiphila DSM 44928]|uniref:Uncharacterized protein n=2 Tax=Catenulispora TaxID=414878 RepID=C7Q856_CATAD|nr:hypothetical protein Caci_5364 [Catenulispora acidiphila DSM 44928]
MLARRLVQQPEHVAPRPLGLEAYVRVLVEEAPVDADLGAAVTRLRALALEALCAGSLSAEQVLDHTRPAALALALAVCTPAEYARPWFRRATGDVRVLLARRLAEELGEDHVRWAAAIDLSGSFAGSVGELLHSDEAPGSVHRFLHPHRSSHATQNLLLALAPRDVAARYLAGLVETRRPNVVAYKMDWMLRSGPLSRPLVARGVGGSVGGQRELLGNDLCPDFVLEQVHGGYARHVMYREIIPPKVLKRAFRAYAASEPAHEVRAWAVSLLGERTDRLMDLAWSLTDAPTLLHRLVAAVLDRADPATLTCLYGALAEAAGPEPVWALDLERAGSLDAVQPAVRASMAAGSAEPLVEAAKRIPRRHWLDVLDEEAFGGQMLRDEAELDRTGHFPLEALVAARLDGRPERWAEVARQVAGGRMPVEAVVEGVVAAAIEEIGESAAKTAPETPTEAAPETTAEAAPQTPAEAAPQTPANAAPQTPTKPAPQPPAASPIAAPPAHAAPSASTT